MATIVWLENDLRIADNAALTRAAALGEPVIPLFTWDGAEGWADGGATRWWLHHSLVALARDFESRGLRLVMRRGPAEEVIPGLAAETGAARVVWNGRHEPARRVRDTKVAARLRASGVDVHVFAGEILHEPDALRTKAGTPYQVFTPFWRRLQDELEVRPPLPEPDFGGFPSTDVPTETIESLELLPRVDWAGGFRETWTPGEAGAHDRLESVVSSVVPSYEDLRNRPDLPGTSRLSPHLHFGELSPRQVWHAIVSVHGPDGAAGPFLRQLAWREFAFHLLHHFPDTPSKPLRPGFDAFPWNDDAHALRCWQRGETGYPIVDAGMRELWHTGWMHNRVRMIVASFLTKDLLIPWQRGAAWFSDTLVDADLANNTLGWQWTAGCGADAQPFYRVFNPVLQGRRFDPEGAYVKRWIPSLRKLPVRLVHEPWLSTPLELSAAGILLGRDYPLPMVDHGRARTRALEAFSTLSTSP